MPPIYERDLEVSIEAAPPANIDHYYRRYELLQVAHHGSKRKALFPAPEQSWADKVGWAGMLTAAMFVVGFFVLFATPN